MIYDSEGKSLPLKEAYGEFYNAALDVTKKCRYTTEVRSLLRTLNKYGFKPLKVDDDEEFLTTLTQEEATIAITNVDYSQLLVEHTNGKQAWIMIVLGNDPGELVCDYHVNPELDKATEEHYNRWEGK